MTQFWLKITPYMAVFLLAAPASADWLVYRNHDHLHLVTADMRCCVGEAAFERTGYEGSGSSVHISDRHGVFTLRYIFDLGHTPWWLTISLTQERNGVIRWEERNSGCRTRVVRWFCDLDAALADPQVRVVLGSLFRRLGQPARVLTVGEIRRTLYGPAPVIDIPHDSVQGTIRFDKAIAGLPSFRASTGLMLAINEQVGQ